MAEFVFLADALALDFVNTEVSERGKHRDLLRRPEDLVSWWNKGHHYHPELTGKIEVDETLLSAAHELRSRFRHLFTEVSVGQKPMDEDLAAINAILQAGYLSIEALEDRSYTVVYKTDSSSRVLFTLALAAARLLTEHDLSRIHHCKNERCILMFYDKSKNGTRRWCSWDCMNRARSIENYRRSKEEKE